MIVLCPVRIWFSFVHSTLESEWFIVALLKNGPRKFVESSITHHALPDIADIGIRWRTIGSCD